MVLAFLLMIVRDLPTGKRVSLRDIRDVRKLLSRILNAEGSDTTDDDSSCAADKKIIRPTHHEVDLIKYFILRYQNALCPVPFLGSVLVCISYSLGGSLPKRFFTK